MILLFNSVHYFLFAPIVIFIFFQLSSKKQKIWLLFASLYFYAVFKLPFLLLLFFSIIGTFYFTKALVASQNSILRKLFLTLSILCNVSILYFFKYIDFSFSAWNTLLGLEPCDPYYLQKWGIILPMGISFFTLQAISYSVDVYRGVIPIHKSLLEFGLYISFFPQLVAGPILRARDILPQFESYKSFQMDNFYQGLRKLTWGFYKKTLLADPVAEIVDSIYANPSQYDWTMMWLAVFLHAIQLYCDFSGYSDIAIGTGRILGFQIPENFLRPFFSKNLSELWSRWHISLSSWLRDYIYISLGGNRVSPARGYVNVFVTFFLSGLWHGADWAVLAWGTFHSILIVIERFFFGFSKIKNFADSIPRYIAWIYPFFIFTFALFFFRAKPAEGMTGIQVAFYMIEKAFSLQEGKVIQLSLPVWIGIAYLFFIDYLREINSKLIDRIVEKNNLMVIVCFGILFMCFLIYSVSLSQPFVYFQF